MPGVVLGTFGDENITHTHTHTSLFSWILKGEIRHDKVTCINICLIWEHTLIWVTVFMNDLHNLSELSTGKGNLVKQLLKKRQK